MQALGSGHGVGSRAGMTRPCGTHALLPAPRRHGSSGGDAARRPRGVAAAAQAADDGQAGEEAPGRPPVRRRRRLFSGAGRGSSSAAGEAETAQPRSAARPDSDARPRSSDGGGGRPRSALGPAAEADLAASIAFAIKKVMQEREQEQRAPPPGPRSSRYGDPAPRRRAAGDGDRDSSPRPRDRDSSPRPRGSGFSHAAGGGGHRWNAHGRSDKQQQHSHGDCDERGPITPARQRVLDQLAAEADAGEAARLRRKARSEAIPRQPKPKQDPVIFQALTREWDEKRTQEELRGARAAARQANRVGLFDRNKSLRTLRRKALNAARLAGGLDGLSEEEAVVAKRALEQIAAAAAKSIQPSREALFQEAAGVPRSYERARALPEGEWERLKEQYKVADSQIKIGRRGAAPSLISAIQAAWRGREVVKLRIHDDKSARKMNLPRLNLLLRELEERTGGVLIECSGSSIWLYRGVDWQPAPVPPPYKPPPEEDWLTEQHTPRGSWHNIAGVACYVASSGDAAAASSSSSSNSSGSASSSASSGAAAASISLAPGDAMTVLLLPDQFALADTKLLLQMADRVATKGALVVLADLLGPRATSKLSNIATQCGTAAATRSATAATRSAAAGYWPTHRWPVVKKRRLEYQEWFQAGSGSWTQQRPRLLALLEELQARGLAAPGPSPDEADAGRGFVAGAAAVTARVKYGLQEQEREAAAAAAAAAAKAKLAETRERARAGSSSSSGSGSSSDAEGGGEAAAEAATSSSSSSSGSRGSSGSSGAASAPPLGVLGLGWGSYIGLRAAGDDACLAAGVQLVACLSPMTYRQDQELSHALAVPVALLPAKYDTMDQVAQFIHLLAKPWEQRCVFKRFGKLKPGYATWLRQWSDRRAMLQAAESLLVAVAWLKRELLGVDDGGMLPPPQLPSSGLAEAGDDAASDEASDSGSKDEGAAGEAGEADAPQPAAAA